MPLSLGNLVVLLMVLGVVYLVWRALVWHVRVSSLARFRPMPKGAPANWPAADDWLNGVAMQHGADAPDSLLPEIYQIVVARALYAMQGLAVLCLALDSSTGHLLFLGLNCGAAFGSRAFRKDVSGTWLESHFSWQIRTFWWTLLWIVVIGTAVDAQYQAQRSTLIQWPAFLLLAIWLAPRVARGWSGLRTQSPMKARDQRSGLDAASAASSLIYLRVVYAFQAMALGAHVFKAAGIAGLLLLVAAAASYLRRARLRGTWLGSHVEWQLRTSLYGWLVLFLVHSFVVPLALTVNAQTLIAATLGAAAGWLAYRILRGWQALAQRGSTLPAGYFNQQSAGDSTARHHVSVVGVATGVLILVAYIIVNGRI